MRVRNTADPIARLLGFSERRVVLNADECKTLQRALEICDKADDLTRDIASDPDYYTGWTEAAVGLREALE